MINYYTLQKEINNDKNKKYCNTLMVIVRKVLYTLYYKQDQKIKNNVIKYKFKKNKTLILSSEKIFNILK